MGVDYTELSEYIAAICFYIIRKNINCEIHKYTIIPNERFDFCPLTKYANTIIMLSSADSLSTKCSKGTKH